MNKKQFTLDSKSLKVKQILNRDFLEIEIYAISEGENRNGSCFTLEGMEKAIPSFYNKFILGYFSKNNDFEEHNSDIKYDDECAEFYYSYLSPDAEKAIGIIRESDEIKVVEHQGKKWIKLSAAILTKYNREAVKHLLKSRNKKKVSVEITVNDSEVNEDGIEIIKDFTLDGITILGTRRNSKQECTEGIEGASMILKFLHSKNYGTQRKALSFAYQSLDESDIGDRDKLDPLDTNEDTEEVNMIKKEEKEGIALTDSNKKLEALENETVEVVEENFAEEKVCDKCGKEECACGEEAVEGKEEEACKEKEEECGSFKEEEACKEKEEECGNFKEEEDEDSCDCDDGKEDDQDDEHDEDFNDQGVDGDVYIEAEKECGNFAFALEDGVEINCVDEASLNNLKSFVEKYSELVNKLNEYKNEEIRKDFISFANNLLAEEVMLSAEEKAMVVDSIVAKFDCKELSSKEEAATFAELETAKIVYKKAKETFGAKKEEGLKEEYTNKIPEGTSKFSAVEEDSFAKMKKILKY